MSASNYTVSASLRRVATGTISTNPKYGIYGCYRDDSNYVQAWIDPNAHRFVTHALVAGTDLSWSGQSPPSGFDTTANHTIAVTRSGSTFSFALDAVAPRAAPARVPVKNSSPP